MSVITEFTVPSESFLLKDSLSAAPDMVVELQQVVAHSREKLAPFFWVHHGDKGTFDETIRRDSTVEDVTLLDEFERGSSYRATWTENADGVAYAYVEAGATILEATGQDDSWTLRMRFDDDDALIRFNEYCRENGIPFSLNRLFHPSQPMSGGQHGLTEAQRETLVTALESGYYEVPRSITMSDLADEVGTSQQTLSKQFRRAHSALVEHTLTVSKQEESTSGD